MGKKILLFIAVLFILPLAVVSSVFSHNLSSGSEVITLPKYNTVNHDYFAAGSSVNLSGNVNGDAYLAGGSITVSGNINGDLIAAGDNITVSGNIKGNVRVLGGNVTVSGTVGRNLTVASGSTNITNTAKIAGRLVSGSGDLTSSAPIGRGATLAGGDVNIFNTIGGGISTNASKVLLGSKSTVGGDLTYAKSTMVDLQKGALIKGKMIVSSQTVPQASAVKGTIDSFIGKVGMSLKLIGLVSALAIALLLVKFTPNYLDKTVRVLSKRPLYSFGVGILILFGVPLLAIVLLLTIIGIPIALILLGALIILSYLSKIFISLLIGQKVLEVLKAKSGRGWAVLVGLVIYTLVSQIPLIGGITAFLALVAGLGAQTVERFALYKEIRSRRLI